MAAKKKSGNGKHSEKATLADVVAAVERLTEHVVGLNGRVDSLSKTMVDGFTRLESRIDNMLTGALGEQVRKHEVEITDLKAKFAKLHPEL